MTHIKHHISRLHTGRRAKNETTNTTDIRTCARTHAERAWQKRQNCIQRSTHRHRFMVNIYLNGIAGTMGCVHRLSAPRSLSLFVCYKQMFNATCSRHTCGMPYFRFSRQKCAAGGEGRGGRGAGVAATVAQKRDTATVIRRHAPQAQRFDMRAFWITYDAISITLLSTSSADKAQPRRRTFAGTSSAHGRRPANVFHVHCATLQSVHSRYR